MFTSLLQRIKEIASKLSFIKLLKASALKDFYTREITSRLKAFLRSETPRDIQKRQYLWAGCIGFALLVCSYGIVRVLFDQGSTQVLRETSKPAPILIETTPQKVDLNEVWRHKAEEETSKLREEISALKKLFQEQVREGQERLRREELAVDEDATLAEKDPSSETLGEEGPSSSSQLGLDKKIKALQDQFGLKQPQDSHHTQTNPFDSQAKGTQPTHNFPSPYPRSEDSQYMDQMDSQGEEGGLIQKFTLNLSSPREPQKRTVESTIPAGAFAKTVLLSGLDASSAMNASSDPRPMLLRLIDPGTLPRRFQSDLKDCHCTASAYGDLSSERIYARLEKLTCIERSTGNIIETQVAGYVAGSDGKAGIRGIVASKDGQLLMRSLIGGMFAGLSNVANPQNRQTLVNPFFQGNQKISPPSMGEMFTSGMAQGASSALDRLSQYYIDRAEQLQPVIQVAAGQVVDIVFTEGTQLGSQTVKAEIQDRRNQNQPISPTYTTQKGHQNHD